MTRFNYKLYALLVLGMIALASIAHSQSTGNFIYRALDNTAVTSGQVTVVQGPANGCSISGSVDLIIDQVGNAGTSPSGTSQKQPAGGVYQCGVIGASQKVTVNCSGGGTCVWQGMRW